MDVGEGSFIEKLEEQLARESLFVHQIAADAMVLYYVFANWIKPETKMQAVERVAGWGPTPQAIPRQFLDNAFREGIGTINTYYLSTQSRNVCYFTSVAIEVKKEGADPGDLPAIRDIADRVAEELHTAEDPRNILLHLLFPNDFEPIAAAAYKRSIVAAFAEMADSARDPDEALKMIRTGLSPAHGPDFSFMDGPLSERWRPATLQGAFESLLEIYPEARASAPFSGEHQASRLFQRIRQLLSASDVIKKYPHVKVKASAGQGNWAKVPWIALMDERETTTTQKGVYCVYLCREDGSGMYLTLNQGVTDPQQTYGAVEGKRRLRERGEQVRGQVAGLSHLGFSLDNAIDLHTTGRGEDYELSTIAYRLYERGSIPVSEVLLQDLDTALSAYTSALDVKPPPPALALGEVTAEFDSALRQARIDFGPDHHRVVHSFLASLLTKPLVILTGLSGSGKTQLAARFGDWLGYEHRLVIAVRPDWTGPESLFGYVDVLRAPDAAGRRAWSVPEAMKFMLAAARDPSALYLLVLDEMNLAHVERYFADFLSGVESREPILPNLVLEEGDWRESQVDPTPLPIPRNLLVVGTVNVDETTYMFSPKVLDRANTMEFRVDTDSLTNLTRPQPIPAASAGVVANLLSIMGDDDWHIEHVPVGADDFADGLRVIHRALTFYGAEFGYRTFYEAVRFAAIFVAAGGGDWEAALDAQILQKVLPRLHGSRRKLEPLLSTLGRLCFSGTSSPSAQSGQVFDPVAPPEGAPRLPRSFRKVQRMTASVRANQFASFTE